MGKRKVKDTGKTQAEHADLFESYKNRFRFSRWNDSNYLTHMTIS